MNLTDDLKNGVLPDGNYFCKTALGDIYVFNCVDGNLFTFADENQVYFVDEILAPCDYDNFIGLTEKVKELEKDIQTLTNNYKQLEKEQASDIAHGQALVEEFGDFEALYEELQRLRKIAVKYECIKINGNYPDKISRLKSRIKHLLELQANQDKELKLLREDLNNYKILAETRGNRLIDLDRKNNNIVKALASYDYNELQRFKKGWELYSHETVITKQLRQLLKESIRLISYEHEVYEAENFIKEVNEVLK